MTNKFTKFTFNKNTSKESALEEFVCASFQYYEAPLRTLALRLLKDHALAQDILQEVFVRFWELRYKIEEINNIEAFLFQMTRNRIMDTFRKIAADERLKEQLWKNMENQIPDSSKKLEAKELQDLLSQAIDELPPRRKEIYLLKNEEGKSYQDIAEEMNISTHTVKNHLSSAVVAIRTFIKKKFKGLPILFL